MATSPAQSPIQALYIAFFQRPADPAGLAYWTGVLNQTHDLAAIAAGFANSQEFGATVAGKPQGDIVNGLFLAMFGRPVDPAGSAYWTQRLVSGELSLSAIVLSIMNGAQGIDQQALANRIGVADEFTTLVNGRANYSGFQDIAYAREFMGPVTDFFATVYTTEQILKFIRDKIADPGDSLYVAPTPSPPANLSFTLTAGIDKIQGGDGNDTIVSTVGDGLGSLDTIDGGPGYDTLTVTDPRVFTDPPWEDLAIAPVAIKNVEAVSITAGGTFVVDATGWTGLTSLTLQSNAGDPGAGFVSPGVLAPSTTALRAIAPALGDGIILTGGGSSVDVVANGSTGGFVLVTGTRPDPMVPQDAFPTGPITISVTSVGAVFMGDIYAIGGTTVSVTQAATNPVDTTTRMGNVVVGGGPATTSATVIGSAFAVKDASTAGVRVGSVLIADYNYASATDAGTITSATVSNFKDLEIDNNALTTLNVSGGQSDIYIDNFGLITPTNLTLNVTMDGQAAGILGDAGVYTTLNLVTTGRDSTLDYLLFPALTALNLSGTKMLTLSLLYTSIVPMLDSITVSGSAGLNALSGALGTALTLIDASGTSGNVTVSIDATVTRYIGGSGVDHVVTSDISQTIDLGDGDDLLEIQSAMGAPTATARGGNGTDTLDMDPTIAETESASTTFASLVTGFEHLAIRNVTNQVIDLAKLGNYSYVITNQGGGLELDNMPSGGTLVLDNAGSAYTLFNLAYGGGANDLINLKLTQGSNSMVDFASTGIQADGVETFAIATQDTRATPTGTVQDRVTLLGDDVKTITVSGNASLVLTADSTALTSVDASGLTLGSFNWTAGTLVGAATVKGSAAGNDIFFGSAATAATTYTGGSGNNQVIINNTSNNVVTAGNGSNTITLGDGNNTVTVGTGSNSITLGLGDDIVRVGAATGVNTVNLGAGNDTLILTGIQTAAANSVVLTMDAGDRIDLSGVRGGSGFTGQTLMGASVSGGTDFASYLALATAGNGSAQSIVKWFVDGGNTYVVLDASAANTFVAGHDSVVKLVGVMNLSTSTIAGNVVTLV